MKISSVGVYSGGLRVAGSVLWQCVGLWSVWVALQGL